MDEFLTIIKDIININMVLATNGFAKEVEQNLRLLNDAIPDSSMTLSPLIYVLIIQNKSKEIKEVIKQRRNEIEDDPGIVDILSASSCLLLEDETEGMKQFNDILNDCDNENVVTMAMNFMEKYSEIKALQ